MRALYIAIGLALLTVPAAGQTSSRSEDRDFHSERRDGDRDRDRSWRDSRHWHGMMSDDRDDRRSGSSGARFMVRSGDAMIAVRCDPDESMRSCVDATLTLVERVRALPGGTGSGTPGATPPRQP